jgi:hypothetical protein
MKIIFQDKYIETVESWNELTPLQAMECYLILFSDVVSDVEQKLILLMQCVTGITDSDLEALKMICNAEFRDGQLIFNAIVSDLLCVTDFLFIELDGKRVVQPALTRCPYPQIGDYHACADEIENLTFLEFTRVLELHNQHTQSQDDACVHELSATVYRPAKPETVENQRSAYNGDIREPYFQREHQVKERIPFWVSVAPEIKHLLMFWLGSCLFEATERHEGLFKRTSGKLNKWGWGGVMLTLADGVIHVDAVANQHFETVLVHLSMLEEHRLEMKQSIDNQSNTY